MEKPAPPKPSVFGARGNDPEARKKALKGSLMGKLSGAMKGAVTSSVKTTAGTPLSAVATKPKLSNATLQMAKASQK